MARWVTERIKKEASLALTGADDVKDKLLALTSIGPRSLYDQVYAVKIRVKSLDSLSSKIVDKRRNKRPSYTAADVTDIVGMRLLCLYAEDLPRTTKALISFFRLCQSPNIKLIDGDTLDEAIHEIRVHKSSNTSRIYDTVYRDCVKLRLSEKNSEGEKKVDLIESDDAERTYSSVHFVVYCLSHSSGTPQRVPLEVQVRTVFEDTWGEIDHSLQYKGAISGSGRIPKKIAPFHNQNKELLGQLKDFLEQSGNLAESIRGGYQAIFDQLARPSKSKAQSFHLTPTYWGASVTRVHEVRKGVPKGLGGEFQKLLDDIEAIQQMVIGYCKNISEARRWVQDMEKLGDRLEKFREKLQLANKEGSEGTVDTVYFLGMEIGILYVWRSKISQHFSINALDTDIDLIKAAQAEYIGLEKVNHLRSDPILNFRLGVIMHEVGLPEHSDFFLYRAYENLFEDADIFRGIMPAVMANFIAFSIWLKRAKLHVLAISSGNPLINREDQRGIIEEAFYFSLISKRLLHGCEAKASWINEVLLNINNNLICYAWELRDLSQGEQEFLDIVEEVVEAVDLEQSNRFPDIKLVKQSIDEIAGPIIEKHTSDNHARRYSDTLMKYYHLIGDVKKLKLYRSQLDDILAVEGNSTKQEEQNELFSYSIDRTKGREKSYSLAVRVML